MRNQLIRSDSKWRVVFHKPWFKLFYRRDDYISKSGVRQSVKVWTLLVFSIIHVAPPLTANLLLMGDNPVRSKKSFREILNQNT